MEGSILYCLVLLFIFGLIADGQIVVNIPTNATQCDPVTLSWSGGTPPYYLLLEANATVPENTPNNPQNQSIVEGLAFQVIYDTQFTAVLYFPAGSRVNFTVTDQNDTTSAVAFVLSAGSSSKCEAKFKIGVENNTVTSRAIYLPPNILTNNVYPCDPTQEVSWSGGTPPYTLSIRTDGLNIEQQQVFGGLDTVGNHQVQIAWPPGVSILVAVGDSKGRSTNHDPVQLLDVQKSDSADCIISNNTQTQSSIPSATASSGFSTPTSDSESNASSSASKHLSPWVATVIGMGAVAAFFLAFWYAARARRSRLPPIRPATSSYARIVEGDTDAQVYEMPQLNKTESRQSEVLPPYRKTTEHNLPSYDPQQRT